MMSKKSTKKPRTSLGFVRLNSAEELNSQVRDAVEKKEETFLSRSYHSTSHIRRYRNSYPDGPIGNYPGL